MSKKDTDMQGFHSIHVNLAQYLQLDSWKVFKQGPYNGEASYEDETLGLTEI